MGFFDGWAEYWEGGKEWWNQEAENINRAIGLSNLAQSQGGNHGIYQPAEEEAILFPNPSPYEPDASVVYQRQVSLPSEKRPDVMNVSEASYDRRSFLNPRENLAQRQMTGIGKTVGSPQAFDVSGVIWNSDLPNLRKALQGRTMDGEQGSKFLATEALGNFASETGKKWDEFWNPYGAIAQEVDRRGHQKLAYNEYVKAVANVQNAAYEQLGERWSFGQARHYLRTNRGIDGHFSQDIDWNAHYPAEKELSEKVPAFRHWIAPRGKELQITDREIFDGVWDETRLEKERESFGRVKDRSTSDQILDGTWTQIAQDNKEYAERQPEIMKMTDAINQNNAKILQEISEKSGLDLAGGGYYTVPDDVEIERREGGKEWVTGSAIHQAAPEDVAPWLRGYLAQREEAEALLAEHDRPYQYVDGQKTAFLLNQLGRQLPWVAEEGALAVMTGGASTVPKIGVKGAVKAAGRQIGKRIASKELADGAMNLGKNAVKSPLAGARNESRSILETMEKVAESSATHADKDSLLANLRGKLRELPEKWGVDLGDIWGKEPDAANGRRGAWEERDVLPSSRALLSQSDDEKHLLRGWNQGENRSVHALEKEGESLAELSPKKGLGEAGEKLWTKEEWERNFQEARQIDIAQLKSHPLRVEYEDKVRELWRLEEQLFQENQPIEVVAERMYQARIDVGIEYKDMTPPLLRKYIYELNEARYGNRYGKPFQELVNEKGYEEIIASAKTPNNNIEKFLKNFPEWLEEQYQQGYKNWIKE